MIEIEELAGESPDYGVFVDVSGRTVTVTQTTGRVLPFAVNGDSRVLQDRARTVFELDRAFTVLAERERELLELKGPCSSKACRLHYAHSGPCDIKPVGAAK